MNKQVHPALSHEELIAAVRSLGLKIRRKDGDYRIAFPNSTPLRARSAYFTADREDALLAARSMAIELANEKEGLPLATYSISGK